MIHFVTTRSHAYTLKSMVWRLGRSRSRRWAYETLFRRRSIPTGTWIFADLDRLSPFELSLAGLIAVRLEAGGARVLNHPARFAGRYPLLRALADAGINDFSVWRAGESPRPGRFPVFIRNEYDHRGQDLVLLPDQAALDDGLARLTTQGVPLAGKLVVEYAGTEMAPGLWRRMSSYRVGDRVIAHHAAYDTKWMVKDGIAAAVLDSYPMRDELLKCEAEFVLTNDFADVLRRAFGIAGIDYGRADFGLMDGRPQIYEINTNPKHAAHGRLYREIHPQRREVQRHSEELLQHALLAVDTPAGPPVDLDAPMLRRQRSIRARWSRALQRA